MKWIVLLIFGGVGLVALIGGVRWGETRWPLITAGQMAIGKVVALREPPPRAAGDKSDDLSQTRVLPLVEFQTTRGELVRMEGNTRGDDLSGPEVGTEMPLVYNPEQPTDALFGERRDTWLGPLVVAIAGLLFIGFGLAGFALMGSSDRALEAAEKRRASGPLVFRADAIHIQATIVRMQRLNVGGAVKYAVVCQGMRPGAPFGEEFQTDSFSFEPDASFIGRSVEVLLDPADAKNYSVELGRLRGEILRRGAN